MSPELRSVSLRDASGTLPCRASHRRDHMNRFAAQYLVAVFLEVQFKIPEERLDLIRTNKPA